MTLLAIPLFAGIPHLINQCILEPTSPMAPYYLAAFCGSTVAALTVMGGTFAVLPAYEADLYGSKYVGAIHGRFLTFGAAATVAGPMLLLNLRKLAEVNAINELLTKVWSCSVRRTFPYRGKDLDNFQADDHHASWY